MEENINKIIKMLEAEKTLLKLKKEKNEAEIWKCNLLINYYMELRQEILIELNERRNDLNGYNSIISLLEKIPSTVLDKLENFISENNFIEKAIDAEEKILELDDNEKNIKQEIIKTKKRKHQLLNKNFKIDKKLIFIDKKLEQPIEMIDEKSIKKKLTHKNSKHK